MQFAGGTLFQLIVPAVFLGAFLKQKDRHAASVMLWWIAQNLWNISVYIADARDLELPLVGGGEHDWNYLLDRMGVLGHDKQIAAAVRGLGVAVFLASTVWGVMTARKRMSETPTGVVA